MQTPTIEVDILVIGGTAGPIVVADSLGLGPAIRPNSRNPGNKYEADFRFSWNQPFAAKPKNWEVAAQVWIASFSAAGPLSSVNCPSLLPVLDENIFKH